MCSGMNKYVLRFCQVCQGGEKRLTMISRLCNIASKLDAKPPQCGSRKTLQCAILQQFFLSNVGYLLHSHIPLHHDSSAVCQRNDPSRGPPWYQVLPVPQSCTAR